MAAWLVWHFAAKPRNLGITFGFGSGMGLHLEWVQGETWSSFPAYVRD